jgi:hypothetical protein
MPWRPTINDEREGIDKQRPRPIIMHSGGAMKYAIAPVLLLAALAMGQTWVVEQLDSTAASGSPVELVKATDGKLWAGYGTKSGSARVACLDDSGWAFTDLCSSARLPSTNFRPFLAASPHGELCLACWDSIADTNRLYRMVNDTWYSEPNPYYDSSLNTVAYDTFGRLYTLIWSYRIGASFGLGHETDSGWTYSFVVQLPSYGFFHETPIGLLTAAADGSPWFFGFCGWWEAVMSDYETDLLHSAGDSWTSVWDVHSGDITPIPLALVPHGDGVGNLAAYYSGGYIHYDSLQNIGWAHPPTAGLAYTAGDIPVAAWTSAASPTFAFRTDRWRSESIPGPVGRGGLDIEVDDSGQVVVVYSTQDSGLWCARGTDVVGVSESRKPQASSHKPAATILSGASGVKRLASSVVFDAMGRRVTNPRSGIFFVRDEGQGTGDVGRPRKVVIQR